MAKETVLITGATSGIGYELSKIFALAGFRLILVGRNPTKLKEVENEFSNKTSCQIIIADLSEENAAEKIFSETEKLGLDVDILVNNAGFGLYGEFTKTDLERETDMIRVNIIALTKLCKIYLPKMIKKRSGKILNLSSTAAFQPGPLMAVYYATKAYVLHFSEGISEELIGSGVSVTALCPGPTESGFQKEARMDKSMEVLSRENVMDTKTVAQIGYNALMNKKVVQIAGLKNAITANSVRLIPRSIVRKIVKRIQQKRS
ncbi:MAG: SDR family NAD(P)-dependent oxidoreductase [Candidatus Bilamarchaeum sp.]|jgi:short-subunit dehydrogenase